MFNFFFSRQTAPVIEAEISEPVIEAEISEPVIVREDFTISNFDQMPIRDLLQMLRDRTYEFALDNNLTTAITEFFYIDELPLTVQLTENYDFLYTVNRFKTYSMTDAIAVIQDTISF